MAEHGAGSGKYPVNDLIQRHFPLTQRQPTKRRLMVKVDRANEVVQSNMRPVLN
jgi:hypothetical protein